MGRSTTPKYRLKYSYISFTEQCRKVGTVAWNVKQDGRPTVSNLKKWRQGFNQSLVNGANKHLNSSMSMIGKVWIERNVRDGYIVCEYQPPAFEVIK